MRIELHVNGGEREADSGRARPCSTRCASGSACPARRTRASRASAARARCCSTACSSARASCWRAQADGHEVVTVEGLARDGALHPVQEAFVERAPCSAASARPGLVVAAADLLDRVPHPNDDEIREALSGNLCRCTGYTKILDAVRLAADAR